MENNFLENYKKKSNQDLQDISENVQAAEIVSEVKPKQVEGNTGEMKFTQESTFKPPQNQLPKRETTKKFPIIAVIIGVVAIIIVLILVFTLNKGVTIVDMVNWSESDVKLWATENGVIVRVENAYSETIEDGNVITHVPAEGEELASGNFIEIIVSEGPDLSVMIPVPDIENMTMTEVEAWADENLMTKVRVTSEASETIESGKVISFTVNDNTVIGDEIRRDTPLYVVFSKGKADGQPVKLPDFTLNTVEEAQEFATENGIILEIVEEFHDTVLKGTIMKQSIKAEETVKSGEIITLNVSKGKEILVPAFSKYSKDSVEAEALKLGITIKVVERYSSSREGAFLSQSKSAGSLYEEGDTIEVKYSLGNTVSLGSFEGQSIHDVNAWADALNEEGANIKISVTRTTSDSAADVVLSQDRANTNIGINDTLHFVVSEGGFLFVPDLVAPEGLPYTEVITRESAMAICKELNLIPIFIEEAKEGRLEGEVWSQSLQPGIEVAHGTTIELRFVPITQTYVVPNFVGLTESEFLAMDYGRQFAINVTIGDYVENMEGKVISQGIDAGKVVAAGTVIDITIGGDELILDANP